MKHSKKSNLTYFLRRRTKLAFVWLILFSAYFFVKINDFCFEKDMDCKSEVLFWAPFLSGALITLAIIFFLKSFVKRKKERVLLKPAEKLSEFSLSPSEFDKSIIRIQGKVVKILTNSKKENFIRKSRDLYRTITGNENHEGRHIHQRFIIKSPSLIKCETIIIYHNTSFGKVDISLGAWLEVEGEYIHREGSRNKYGLIHYTHSPKGKVTVLKNTPERDTLCKLIVKSKNKKPKN